MVFRLACLKNVLISHRSFAICLDKWCFCDLKLCFWGSLCFWSDFHGILSWSYSDGCVLEDCEVAMVHKVIIRLINCSINWLLGVCGWFDGGNVSLRSSTLPLVWNDSKWALCHVPKTGHRDGNDEAKEKSRDPQVCIACTHTEKSLY